MKKTKKYLFILFFVTQFTLFADVYLLTQKPPYGWHSALLVTETVTNQNGEKVEQVKSFLSKYPGTLTFGKRNAAFRVTADGIVEAQDEPVKTPESYEQVFNLREKKALGGYDLVKLSIISGSEMENNIVNQISIYQKTLWWNDNCGQSTRGVLQDAGYFNENVLALMDISIGGIHDEKQWINIPNIPKTDIPITSPMIANPVTKMINSPVITEYWVKYQEWFYSTDAKERSNEKTRNNIDRNAVTDNETLSDSETVENGDSVYQSSDAARQILLNGGANDQTVENGDLVCHPSDDNNSSDDNAIDGDDITDNETSSNDESVEFGDMCLPPDDNNYITEEGNNENSDDAGNIVAGWSGIREVFDTALDETAIVGPTIPHKRVLWLFSGESLLDSITSLWNGVTGNAEYKNQESTFEALKGKLQ